MTNREYLNTLPNDIFTDLVLVKQVEFHKGNYDEELDIFDITVGTRMDFEKWLEEEHEELKKVSLKELKVGTKFKFAGHEFTKLADEEQSCYCLLNGTVFESNFGETNDWAKSPIRECLNAFDESGNSKAISGIKKEDLVAVSLNYRSYNNPNGRTTDRITVLSYDEWLCWNVSPINKRTWLRSGPYDGADRAYYLLADGTGSSSDSTSYEYSVRPALHLKADLEVEVVE